MSAPTQTQQEVQLRQGGKTMPVENVGSGIFQLCTPEQLTDSDAELIVTIDGYSTHNPIRLTPTKEPTCEYFYVER